MEPREQIASPGTKQPTAEEFEALKERLREAEEALEAIHTGEVDAIVVTGAEKERIYTLSGADHLYRTIIESMTEGAVIIIPDGTISYCNSKFAKLLGGELNQVIGTSIFEHITAHTLPLFMALLRDASLTPAGNEISLKGRNAREVPVLCSVNTLNTGSEIATCIVMTDLTEQKRTAELVEESRLSGSILEQAAEAIIVCDNEGYIVRANGMAGRLIGRNPILLPYGQAFQSNGINEAIARALNGEVVRGVETSVTGERKETFQVLLSASPLANEARILGCVVNLTDITKAKETEERLRLAIRSLKEREEELVRSNEELARFAFIASHDLKEPLRNVSNYVQLLEKRYRGNLDETADQYIDYVVSGVNRMFALIEDVLRYSKAGAATLEPSSTPARDIVAQALENLDAAIKETGASVRVHDLPIMRADRKQLVQVFQNLVENAIKYRSDKPLEIEVYASETDDHWQFTVADKGMGIEPQYFEKIFQIFQRLHRREDIAGTGIGLALCKRIVERHRGRIWVSSVPGEGSSFIFTVSKQLPKKDG